MDKSPIPLAGTGGEGYNINVANEKRFLVISGNNMADTPVATIAPWEVGKCAKSLYCLAPSPLGGGGKPLRHKHYPSIDYPQLPSGSLVANRKLLLEAQS